MRILSLNGFSACATTFTVDALTKIKAAPNFGGVRR
jgi:hypothetical protein